MTEPKVEPIDKNKLPWYYRLILKIPGSEFVESTSSGIFWGLIVPVFLVLEFALNITLLLFFPFPTNIALVIIIPAAILLVFLRVSMERFINWWNSIVDNSFEWNIERTMPEYLDLLKKREEKKE
jgi:sensor histidine kinase YesM